MTAMQYSFDDEAGIHDPALYDFAAVESPLDGFAAVDDAAVARYHARGVIAIEQAFHADEVQAALAGLTDLIAGKAPDFTNIQFRGDVRDRVAQLTLDERIDAVRRLLYFVNYDERIKAIAHHPALLATVEKMLGAPAELFQDMALIKPPRGREKPWHQDHAYFELPLSARVVGVWIALDEADVANGCMRFLPAQHRTANGAVKQWQHTRLRDLQIRDEEMNGLATHRCATPLAPGGLVMFDSFIPHGTPSNFTNQRRRALQFHYKIANTPKITAQERISIWCGAVTAAEC